MDLIYATKKLEKKLKDERTIKKHFTKNYHNLIIRLSELRAANNLSEITHLPPPNRHALTGNYQGHWGIDISKNYRIILKPITWDGVNLASITGIQIIDIDDYH